MEKKIKIIRNVRPKIKRSYVYEALPKLRVGDGFDVDNELYRNTLQGCIYASENMDKFRGWKFQSQKKNETTMTIIRVA